MKSKLLSALLGLIISASVPAMAQSGSLISTYQSIPFWMDGQTIPHVMLVLERDWKMFYPAYNNLADLDGDGALDIGFNPGVTYVGYFDSNSCYTYKSTGKGQFERSGPTTILPAGEAANQAPQTIKDSGLKIPDSIHGVCGASGGTDKGTSEWHGNWLNYSMTSRMDAIRKVLYGGKREIDTKTETILEMIYVPGNAHVWGGELYADNIWEQYAPSSPWYDIAKFTGFHKPADNSMHFWARGSVYWNNPLQYPSVLIPNSTEQINRTKSNVPLLRVVANIPSTNLHPSLKTPVRIWDWVGDHSSYGSLPADGNLAKSKNSSGAINSAGFLAPNYNGATNQVAYNFSARVVACQPGNFSSTEGCRTYGTTSNKPIGLLQQYGESERMFFGLLTGSLQYTTNDTTRVSKSNKQGGTRYRGGVVRHHVQTFDNYIHQATGQIKRQTKTGYSEDALYDLADSAVTRIGLIATIDALEITGLTASYDAYGDGTQAGNPLGEMVWEAVRYLVGTGKNPSAAGTAYTSAGGLNPSSFYLPAANAETSVKDHNKTLFKLPLERTWDQRPKLSATDTDQDCLKPVVLVISEVFPDHDDSADGNYPNQNDFSSVPLLEGISETDVPKILDIDTYLDKITSYELGTAIADGQQFFYPDDRGLCTAKKLIGVVETSSGTKTMDGLKDILGHCPSEPSLEGSYNIAAVAYYAHTHNFTPLAVDDYEENKKKYTERNVDIYSVGIAGNFPDITLTVDDERSITVMPITLASLLVSSSTTEGKIDNELKTLLNFFIEYWMTDDGHEYEDENGVKRTRKVPYKVKFSTNSEFTTTPCFTYGGNSNNWERDIFNTFIISLLTTADTPTTHRETAPLYINSGPYKTNQALYLADRNTGNYTSQTYYYAFKRPASGTLDIVGSGFNVAGVAVHTDTFGSGYGSGGMAGYTLTGVTFPGAYIDVGLYRADYPLYYTNRNSFQAGASSVDEPVPLDPSGTGIPGAKWPFNTANAPIHYGSTHYTTNGADCYYYHPPTLTDALLTPAECPYYGYTNSSDWSDPDMVAAYSPRPNAARVCGENAAGYYSTLGNYPSSLSYERYIFNNSLMRYVQVRSFKFNESDDIKDKPAKLPNPMWLAAKYGGFKDYDGNGRPNLDSEWKRGGDGIGASDPYNYFGVANMSELPKQLGEAFEAIANSVATGTANASSVSMVLGGGVSVQSQYRSFYSASEDPATKIKWAGTTYAFFMDKWGNLREDTNRNGKLDLVTSPIDEEWNAFYPHESPPSGYEKGDLIVHTVAPAGTALPLVYLCRDPYGDNNGGIYLPSDVGEHPPTPEKPVTDPAYPPHAYCGNGSNLKADMGKALDSLDAAKGLWNSAQKLSDMGHGTNPGLETRRLYTYLGSKTADGKTNWTSGGVEDVFDYPFKSDPGANLNALHKFMGQVDTSETADLIEYIRGSDKDALGGASGKDKYRNRTVRLPWDAPNSTPKVWRMGDVINSQPVLVGQPSSGYHQSYGDQSFAAYRTNMAKRRQVSYFGSNDGILHAINLGFFGALIDGQASYSRDPQEGTAPNPNYDMGEEIWGYLPPSVLSHLQLMANEAYEHSYYVDLSPQVVDIKNGSEWRTVLIVGLRLGGAPIELLNGDAANPYTAPEFFALDITDPEATPKLMWRFSHATLGQSTALPTVVRSGHDDRWYVVLPSGPAQVDPATGTPHFEKTYIQKLYDGRSSQRARVIILDAITGEYARLRDKDPDSFTGVVDPLMVSEEQSFFNNTFTPRARDESITVESDGTAKWGHHAVYLGLSAIDASNNDSGAVYRLQMVDDNGAAVGPDSWKLTRFYKTDKPVTASVNSSYDSVGNLWVTFGTGRIWGKDDMTPCGVNPPTPACAECYEQYLYGIKEPLIKGPSDVTARMSFAEVPKDVDILDMSGIKVYNTTLRGGLLSPASNVTGKTDFESLYTHMLSKTPAGEPIVRGYKVKLETWTKDISNYKLVDGTPDTYVWTNPSPTSFELVNTQVQLDELANRRVNAVVTSYIPSNNVCDPLGESYLMVYDAFVGLPAPYMAAYGTGITGEKLTVGSGSDEVIYDQVTATKKVGAGMASQAWVLKTDGGTTYGATGFAGQRVVFRVPPEQSDHSRFISWREVQDMNLTLKEKTDLMFKDLKTTP